MHDLLQVTRSTHIAIRYGNGIWHTWFDRDLALAGRVLLSDPNTNGFASRLVQVRRPVLRIPTIAIHLNRDVNTAFKFNTETDLVSLLCMFFKPHNASLAVALASCTWPCFHKAQ